MSGTVSGDREQIESVDCDTCRQEDSVQERLLDFTAYCLTAAHGLAREPAVYGPMRLVDAMFRALELFKEVGVEHPGLEHVLEVVRRSRWQATEDPDGFAKALDQAIHRLVDLTLRS